MWREERAIYFYYYDVFSLLDIHFLNIGLDVRLEVERLQAGRLHHLDQGHVQGEVGPAGHLGKHPRQAGSGVNISRGATGRDHRERRELSG